MNRDLTMRMGTCPPHWYAPHRVELVRTGAVDPVAILTETEPLTDRRQPGWIEVELEAQA